MASVDDIRQLLEGCVARNPFQAFGISSIAQIAEVRRECKQKQALYHQDKGNPVIISQLANACADSISGRSMLLDDGILASAESLLADLRAQEKQDAILKTLQEWRTRDRAAHFNKVVSAENVERGKLVLASFERVPRTDASAFVEVKLLFRRAFNLTPQEAGWLMGELGIKGHTNYKKVYVACEDKDGLKIPTARTHISVQCPICSYCVHP